MKYLLDTNTCIRHLNQRSPEITDRLNAIPESDITLCSVVKAELFTGAMKSQLPQQTLIKQEKFAARFTSLPFDDSSALVYAKIRASLEKLGTPIGANDLLIAAIAISNNLILVSHNIREFGRIPELQLEDWDIN